MTTARIVSNWADLPDTYPGVWADLWARTRPVPPMLEWSWVQAWWQQHRDEGRLLVLVVNGPDGRPLGLAPLYVRDEGLKDPKRCLRTVAFLGTGEREQDEVTGEYTTWLAAPADLPAVSDQVAAYLQTIRGDWDRLRLERMSPQSGIMDQLETLLRDEALNVEHEAVPAFRSPVLPLEEWLAALPSSNFRHRCRRALRAGRDEGVQFVRAREPGECKQMFGVLRELHQQRWQGRGERGVFSSPVFTRFHENILDSYLREQRVWMVGEKHGDRWLAVRYLLRAGDRLYDYLSGVDTGTSTALAPGLLLHLHTIDACAADRIAWYDLMAGDYDYKRKLGTDENALPTLDLFARTVRSRLWLTARDLRRNLKVVRTPAPEVSAPPVAVEP